MRPPKERSGHGAGPAVDDHLAVGIGGGGFAGRKPEAWTHWVLDMLGYDPSIDELYDLFPGSGSVTAAVNSYRTRPSKTESRQKSAPAIQAQQVRRTVRAVDGRRAAVLSALRAGVPLGRWLKKRSCQRTLSQR